MVISDKNEVKSAGLAAVGAWRALQALRMRAPAHWLERELAHRDRYAGRV